MKIILVLIIFLFQSTIVSYSQFRINGNVPSSYENDTVYLYLYKQSQIDTIYQTVVKNSHFKFTGNEYLDRMSKIHIKTDLEENDLFNEVILEKGNISIDFNNSRNILSGTLLNNKYQMYIDSCEYYFGQIRKMSLEMDKKTLSLNYDYNKHIDNLYMFLINIILDNTDNLICKTVIQREIFAFPEEYFNILNNFIKNTNKKNNTELTNILDLAKKELNDNKSLLKLKGSKLPIIYTLNQDSINTDLLDVVKNNTLTYIEFWASYCSPCLKLMDEIKDFRKQSNIQFVSISIDSDYSIWKNTLKKHNYDWLQLIIGQDKIESVRNNLFINTIPFSLLINSNGEIIEINIKPSELSKFISDYDKHHGY